MSDAIAYLERAQELLGERGKSYDTDSGERYMANAVAAFNAITGHTLTEGDGWLMLQVVKDCRQWRRAEFHRDSAEDCVAYAALKAEALGRT